MGEMGHKIADWENNRLTSLRECAFSAIDTILLAVKKHGLNSVGFVLAFDFYHYVGDQAFIKGVWEESSKFEDLIIRVIKNITLRHTFDISWSPTP